MLTWHVVRNIEIPIIVILAHIELSRLNIFNCCLHFAATTLSQADFFECVAYDVFFIVRLRLEELEMNWRWLCVPLNVLDIANHNLRNPVLLTTSTELTKNEVTPSTLASAKSNNCFGVRIWFEKGCWRLACAARLLTVLPTPLQSFFPCDVAKNPTQHGCRSCFDGISDLISVWSSYIALLSHHWNGPLCA